MDFDDLPAFVEGISQIIVNNSGHDHNTTIIGRVEYYLRGG